MHGSDTSQTSQWQALLETCLTAELKCGKKGEHVMAGLIKIMCLWVNAVILVTIPYENWLISSDPDQITAYRIDQFIKAIFGFGW